MGRLVFFGMSGGFSAITLRALASSGHRPVLVVHGLDPSLASNMRGPIVERERSTPGLISRLFGPSKEATAPSEPPQLEAGDTDLSRTAKSLKLDTLRTTDANAARSRAAIAEANADVFFVAGFPHLLSPDVLKLTKRGGLNLHPGKLPEERGPSPLFWALREGKTKLDFTVHVLDAGEDTGDIISAGAITFAPGTPGLEILDACARAAAPHVLRALRGMIDGDLVRTSQSKSAAARRSRPTFRDGRIDATKSAEAVFTFAGGCAATYSVFVEVANDRFFIRRAISFDPAGTLAFEYALTGDRLLLRCNPGIVELELKEEGALFSAEYEEGDSHV